MVQSLNVAGLLEVKTNKQKKQNRFIKVFKSCFKPKSSFRCFCFQGKTAGMLVKMRQTYREDHLLQSTLRETLALIGYVDPVKGRGIRVLSIDGGGTR